MPGNIRIDTVCPGVIDTPMMERFGGGTAEGRKQMIARLREFCYPLQAPFGVFCMHNGVFCISEQLASI